MSCVKYSLAAFTAVLLLFVIALRFGALTLPDISSGATDDVPPHLLGTKLIPYKLNGMLMLCADILLNHLF
jgi:hypothetical protein